MNEEKQQEVNQSGEQQQDQELSKEIEAQQVAYTAAMQLLEQRVKEIEGLAVQYKDQLLRKAAEFENYKKRVENDFVERAKFANENLVLTLLPVIDDFERSLKSGKENKDYDTLYRGIELINQKLFKVLERNGVTHYDSVGKPFDPHLHDALLQVPNAEVPPHTVINEVEKGYMMYGKVLRHAKVIVSGEMSDELQPITDESGEKKNNESPKAEKA